MQLREKYVIVSKIINKYDPEQLLAGGAPDDEYSLECKEIAAYEIDQLTVVELAQVICNVFSRMFATSYQLDYCTAMATEIKAGMKS